MKRIHHDGPLIIGGGLAGLSAALSAAPRKVIVISPAPLLEAASSAWAQGGVAAALSKEDAPALHLKDTEAAGAGLVDHHAAEVLTDEGRATVEWLASLGAPFDRDAEGGFAVSREAAHSMARVARVGGDGAGRAILSALVASVRAAEHITVWEDARLRALIQDETGRVCGAVIEHPSGRLVEVLAAATVLATGGAGGLFGETTTPTALKGEGMALAWRAGADILDPEFVQFHPTAIDVGLDPMPLATEALRGEGARLIDRDGAFLLGPAPDADLKARDIVARAVHAARASGRGAFLDARTAVGEHFPHEFPAVFAACMRAGLDPRVSPIPMAPAAHYHMGGVASNSLLEAAAFGRRTGREAAKAVMPTGPVVAGAVVDDLPAEAHTQLRAAMSAEAGVIRDATGLSRLVALIDRLEAAHGAPPALVAARLIAEAALARHESRGGHYRSDYPETAALPEHTHVRHGALVSEAA